MLRISFNSVADLADPPILKAIAIGVAVSDIQTFQLYNDFGALSTKMPFTPFGTVPVKNSNFIIGNNEIFSKPLDSLFIELNWNNLPKDFFNYYKEYNGYLFANGITKKVQKPSLFEIIKPFPERVFKGVVYVGKCLINWLNGSL